MVFAPKETELSPLIGRSRGDSEATVSYADKSPAQRMEAKQKLLKAKERRATLSLTLILGPAFPSMLLVSTNHTDALAGSFIACWLPFFMMYLLAAIPGADLVAPPLLFDLAFWLGYCNSALNPVSSLLLRIQSLHMAFFEIY